VFALSSKFGYYELCQFMHIPYEEETNELYY
jgi:hypothetical protein